MLLLSFFFIVYRESLAPNTFTNLIQSLNPLVVRFSSQHRPRSVQLNQDWQRFSSMYEDNPDIRVGYVNCGKFPRLCLREGCWDPPMIKLYFNRTEIQYDGGMSYESLGDWTKRYTGIQGKPVQLDLLSPNNRTFHQLIKNTKCVFVMFHTPECKKCQQFMCSLTNISRAFRNEENVSICEIDADKYKSFLFDFSLHEFPQFDLFVNGNRQIYDGEIQPDSIVDYINDYCDVNRNIEGRLSSDAGIIDEIVQLVEDFMKKKSASYMNEMKFIKGAEPYIEIMNQVLEVGNQFLFDERNRISSILAQDSSSQDVLDRMQIRYNILSLFISFIEMDD